MNDVLRALGFGLVKLLIAVAAGVGTGLIVFGDRAEGRPEIMEGRIPPPEMFFSVGAGLLTTAALLLVMFFFPRRTPRQ